MAFIIPGNLNSWFEISQYFTFRWVDNNITSEYNTLPLDSEQDALSYRQPVQCGGGGYQSDTGQIQLTSNYVPTGGLYDLNTNALIKAINFVPIDPPILGVTFICYNAEIDFSDVDPGEYYGRIIFTDSDETEHDYRTNPLDVQIFHDGTQLMEATNFTNDKGIVFVNPDLTTLVIRKRIGSLIRLPLPKTDATDYEDQYNDLDQQQSIPFVTYTQLFYDPNGYLLPFYEIEKINLLYSLDQVLTDGQPFAKLSNSDFKPTRSDIGQQPGWWEVDIQPNFSYPSDQFITGTPPDGEYIVIKKQITFLAKSADFACTGIFSARKNLIRIAVDNNGGDVFTMKIGTTAGAEDLGRINFPDDDTDSIDIGKYFKIPTTVYISGIDGTNLDITFDYNDYGASAVVPPDVTSPFAKNTLYYFDEIVPGSFAVEFDIATGLGRVGTDHEGCVLADGRNGVPYRVGKVVKIWDSLEVFPAATRGTNSGNADNQIELTVEQLPAHNFKTFNGDSQNAGGNDLVPGQHVRMQRNAGINRDYIMSGSSTVPDRGNTNTVGAGDPINVANESIILPAFYYVGV